MDTEKEKKTQLRTIFTNLFQDNGVNIFDHFGIDIFFLRSKKRKKGVSDSDYTYGRKILIDIIHTITPGFEGEKFYNCSVQKFIYFLVDDFFLANRAKILKLKEEIKVNQIEANLFLLSEIKESEETSKNSDTGLVVSLIKTENFEKGDYLVNFVVEVPKKNKKTLQLAFSHEDFVSFYQNKNFEKFELNEYFDENESEAIGESKFYFEVCERETKKIFYTTPKRAVVSLFFNKINELKMINRNNILIDITYNKNNEGQKISFIFSITLSNKLKQKIKKELKFYYTSIISLKNKYEKEVNLILDNFFPEVAEKVISILKSTPHPERQNCCAGECKIY